MPKGKQLIYLQWQTSNMQTEHAPGMRKWNTGVLG